MPAPTPSLINNFASWSAECSLDGAYGGSVAFTNEENQYDFKTMRNMPIKVQLGSAIIHVDGIDEEEQECFAGLVTWLHGLLQSADDAYDLAQTALSARVKSFFAGLANKPINTWMFTTETVDEIIETLLTVFGGKPSELLDIDLPGAVSINSVVSGNNLLEEIRSLAQCSKGVAFVQRDGLFTVRPWKTAADETDIVIPDAAVVSAMRSRDDSLGISRITIRGRLLSEYDAGPQTLSDGGSSPTGGGSGGGGGKIVCIKNGVGEREAPVKMRNLKGGRNDLRGAAYMIGGGIAFARLKDADDNKAEVQLLGAGGAFLGEGDHEAPIKVRGRIRPKKEIDGPNARQKPLKKNQANTDRVFERYIKELSGGGGGGGPAGGAGAPNKGGNRDNDKMADEHEETQIEMIVDDPDLQDEFGVIYEQIDSPYAPDMESLFQIAVRRFQEFKMQRNRWNVNAKYLPCLELNQVVQFTTPDGSTTVTGLLTGIQLSYSTTPEANMALTIDSFDEIGETEYTSGNLFMYPQFIGGPDGVFWKSNADRVVISNHTVLMLPEIGDYLEQTIRTSPGEYLIEIEAESTDTGTPGVLTVQAFDVDSSTSLTYTSATLGSLDEIPFTAIGDRTRLRVIVTNDADTSLFKILQYRIKRVLVA